MWSKWNHRFTPPTVDFGSGTLCRWLPSRSPCRSLVYRSLDRLFIHIWYMSLVCLMRNSREYLMYPRHFQGAAHEHSARTSAESHAHLLRTSGGLIRLSSENPNANVTLGIETRRRSPHYTTFHIDKYFRNGADSSRLRFIFGASRMAITCMFVRHFVISAGRCYCG